MDKPPLPEAFRARFGQDCKTVARAPGRVNLIGEHTDYNDGYVLPMAIEFDTWVACIARRDNCARVFSADLSEEQSWTLDAWRDQPRPHWTSYVAGVADLLRQRGVKLPGFDLLIQSHVPVGSGLSSSAALEVATALALSHLADTTLEPTALANLCRTAEHTFAGVPCGIMDQYVSVLARADTAFLLDCRTRAYEYIPFALDEQVVVIVDSGVRHALATGEYARRQEQCVQAVTYFQNQGFAVRALRDVSVELVAEHAPRMDPLPAARARHVTSENQRTLAAVDTLRHGDLPELGRLMAASHDSLRDEYEVSCAELDRLVEIVSTQDGVLGARMTGGGFGGCIVAIADRACVPRIEDALRRQYDPTVVKPARLFVSRPGRGASLESA